MFGHGYFGAGYYGPGYWGPASGTPTPTVTTDTHDGFDEDIRKRVRERVRDDEDAFRSKRERLRDALTLAWDGPGEIASEVQALASPYVDILESGALRIDYTALEARNAAAVLELETALRAEFAARMAAFEADEEDVMLLTSWN